MVVALSVYVCVCVCVCVCVYVCVCACEKGRERERVHDFCDVLMHYVFFWLSNKTCCVTCNICDIYRRETWGSSGRTSEERRMWTWTDSVGYVGYTCIHRKFTSSYMLMTHKTLCVLECMHAPMGHSLKMGTMELASMLSE